MREMTIGEAQAFCLKRNISFYSYRLPGREEIYFGAQTSGKVTVFNRSRKSAGEEGFIAVPFVETAEVPALLIRGDISFTNMTADQEICRKMEAAERLDPDHRVPEESVSRRQYHEQVTRMISALQGDKVQKTVLARGWTVETEGYRHAPRWFEKLTGCNPEAFVFLVSVPGVMTWMGATPEIFLQQTVKGAETMALAGTRPVGTIAEWGNKEIEEQAIVSDYIATLLSGMGSWKAEGPFSKRAGKMEHLCTTFTSDRPLPYGSVEQLRQALHPTPAVGGFPVCEAMAMIGEIEGNGRRYYAGYLGPLHADGTFHWFVNLRSMEIFHTAVRLYIGGGITALSDPIREWEETELKSRTLSDVIGGYG